MSDLRFECPFCKQPLDIPEDLLGQVVACPACSGQIQLPEPQTAQPLEVQTTLITPLAGVDVSAEKKTKQCLYCAEEILIVAVKCKHCGSDLTGKSPAKNSQPLLMQTTTMPLAGVNLPPPSSKVENYTTEVEKRLKSQFIMSIPVAIVFFILNAMDNTISIVGMLILVAVAIYFTLKNYKCPSCNKYVNIGFPPKFCKKCGGQLRANDSFKSGIFSKTLFSTPANVNTPKGLSNVAHSASDNASGNLAKGMTRCSKCNEVISKGAKTCPKCGDPRKKETGCLSKIVAAICLLVGLSWMMKDGCEGAKHASAPSAPAPVTQPSTPPLIVKPVVSTQIPTNAATIPAVPISRPTTSVIQRVAIDVKSKPVAAKAPESDEKTAIFDDSEWTVISARNLGSVLESHNQFVENAKSEGKFIKVVFKVKNLTKEEERLLDTPKLVDSQGRVFREYEQSPNYLAESEKTLMMEALPPSMPRTCCAIYEVPADSVGLKYKARNFAPFLTETKLIDLGLDKAQPTSMPPNVKEGSTSLVEASPLKVKGLYIGMDIQTVPALLKGSFGDVELQTGPNGMYIMFGVIIKASSVWAGLDGKVNKIELDGMSVDLLFKTKDMDASDFVKQFNEAYKIQGMKMSDDFESWTYTTPFGERIKIDNIKGVSIEKVPSSKERKQSFN